MGFFITNPISQLRSPGYQHEVEYIPEKNRELQEISVYTLRSVIPVVFVRTEGNYSIRI